jgi:hypothetical protein
MRRAFVLSVCAAALLVAAASPALAQKDPFDPLVTEDTGATDTTAPTDPTEPDVTVDPGDGAPAPPADEPMPDTGTDPSRWLAIAWLAIAAGAGLVMLARILRPAPARRQAA